VFEASRSVRRHLGFEPSDLSGKPLSVVEILGDSDVSLFETVRVHGAFSAERALRRVDGSVCVMHVRAALEAWKDRGVIVVTLRDVRDRKRVEEKFHSVFDNTIEGIFQTTASGKYLSANPALARMYGYTSPRALMDGLTDIAGQLYVDPSRRAEFRRLLEENDAVYGFESEIRRRDGGVIWISENARAVRDSRGALLCYEGTVIDISKRKRAEAAQRNEAEVARALADFGREMMSSIDSPQIFMRLCELSAEALGCDWAQTLLWDTVRDAYVPVSSMGTIPSELPVVSRAALSALFAALEREEVLILDENTADVLPPPLRALQRGCTAALYFAVRRRDVCVGVLSAGYRTRPEPFTDVQRRVARGIAHLASLALEHSRVLEELARANEVKTEFLATMSHELRTPLHIILGYNELMQTQQVGPLTAEQRDMVGGIQRSANELLEMISATLDMSRLGQGQVPIDLDWIELPDLLSQLDGEIRGLLRDKPEITLEWTVADGLPTLYTDPGKLKVILKNLVHNAIKFTDRGSITVTAVPHEEGIEVSVSDQGIGIAPEALPIIFQAFRQADGSMTRRHGGVGLGLHVVRRLAELLGGSVSVQSQVGKGSTFRVRLRSRQPESRIG
jgi:PAS domain S-box-containing protein